MPFEDQYIIPFKRLEQGVEHQFDFKVDNEFFDHFPYSELKEGQVDVHVRLTVNPDNLILHFHLKGEVKVTCDRCLEEFMHPIDYETTLYVKLGDYTTDWYDYDDRIVLHKDETRIDISKHIYDFIQVALPIKKVHPPDEDGNPTCNPEMLKLLEQYSPEHKEENEDIDPRWADLLKLKDKLNN